jgi:metal-responsive CopG/Arc/MetJ family transcriptional regulator
MARMNVAFADSLLEDFRRLVPARQRSQFIAEAVQDRLLQLKQEKAAQAAAGAWSSTGRREPEEEIREIRREWEARSLPSPDTHG